MGGDIEDLISKLKPLAESYRLLVSAADEFNGIAPAHKKDVKKAIDRAGNLGDIIDDVISTLDEIMPGWLKQIKKHS